MRRLLALCCAVVFLDAAFFSALAPLLPSLTRDYALSGAGAGVLAGSYAAGVLLMAIPGGWFAAQHGARLAVLVGCLGMGAFTAIFGFANQIWLLDVARFLQGASGALMWAGAMSWVITSGPAERRGALVGTLVAAATVGELLGAPVGAIAHEAGMSLVFGIVAVFAFVLFAFAFTLRGPEPRGAESLSSVLGAARGTHLISSLWLLAAAAFAFGVAVVIAPLHLDSLGGSAALIAASFACGSIVETILGPLIGRLSDKVGRARPYRIGALLGAAAIVAIAELPERWMVFGSMVIFAFAAGMAFAPSMALTADSASEAGIDQGYASGLTNVAFGGGQMLGAVGGGALTAVSFLLPALAAALILGSGAVVAGRVARRESDADAPLGSSP